MQSSVGIASLCDDVEGVHGRPANMASTSATVMRTMGTMYVDDLLVTGDRDEEIDKMIYTCFVTLQARSTSASCIVGA